MRTNIQNTITTLLRMTALVSFLVGPVGAYAYAQTGDKGYIAFSENLIRPAKNALTSPSRRAQCGSNQIPQKCQFTFT